MAIVNNGYLIGRIYFPRVLLPLTAIAAACVDAVCMIPVMIVCLFWYGHTPSIGLLALPPMLLLAAATVLGMSLWLGALHASYRDIGQLLPFVVQIWMFASPVIYPVSLLPAKYAMLYALNPLVVVIQTSRWAFCSGVPPHMGMVAAACGVAGVLCTTGLWFFRRSESTFSDIV